MRLFVGIPLAAATLDELVAVAARLRSGADGLRWTAPASWHITLQFLGECSPAQCENLIASLRRVQGAPVLISLEKLGCFERVFLATVQRTPQLLALQQGVAAATVACGFPLENRPYQPHITLARSRETRQDLGQLANRLRTQSRFSGFAASEFLLYQSFLGPAGARYEVRARFPLG